MTPSVLHQRVLLDLVSELPVAVRLQRLVARLRSAFDSDAVALLRLDGDHLRPVAVDGLVIDALGRRYPIKDHPRLAAILQRREVIRFHHDSTLPDPYDGLVAEREGLPLAVHDCMGLALEIDGEPWGVITFDALRVGSFGTEARAALAELSCAIEAAIRVTRLEAEIRGLRHAGGGTPALAKIDRDEAEILGQSESITGLLHELQVVAESGLPVLLLGETGVGKELIAHRVHRLSQRADRPMVQVNCAALPESLAESELFGHVRGAYSGAVSERPGRFEAADGGTLFLDEVGELPLAIQAKLLRTLQNGEIQRLGADHPRRVDVRIIAATNRSLRDLVREGTFRADLYHRLSVYPIPIPPLRERGNDVLLLAGHFLERNRARLGLRSLRLSLQAEAALRRYRWPGNVREVEYVISRAALKALSRGADRRDIVTLDASMLDLDGFEVLDGAGPADAADGIPGAGLRIEPAAGGRRSTGIGSGRAGPPAVTPLADIVRDSQRQAIEATLARHGDNWAAAARALDLDPSNLHKLARRLGLKPAATAERKRRIAQPGRGQEAVG